MNDVIPHSEFEVASSMDGELSLICTELLCMWEYDSWFDDQPSDFSLDNLNRLAAIHTRAPFEYTVKDKCRGSFWFGSVVNNTPDFVSMMEQRCQLCSIPFKEHP